MSGDGVARLLAVSAVASWLAMVAYALAASAGRARERAEWGRRVEEALSAAGPAKTLHEAESFERIAGILAANEAARADWDGIWVAIGEDGDEDGSPA